MKLLIKVFQNISNLFRPYYKVVDLSNNRPAFMRYQNDYYADEQPFNSLIINLKKEVNFMSARELVLEQLNNLKKEKDNLVAQVLSAEAEKIETLKVKAAEEAEALYKKEVEDKVAFQFKIAEEHLTKLLSELPEETHEQTSESETDTEEQPQI